MDELASFVSCACTAGQSSGVFFFLCFVFKFIVCRDRAHRGTFTIFSTIQFLLNVIYGVFCELPHVFAHK